MHEKQLERRAVDSTMNITTDADGGFGVPTGLAPKIAMRMNEKWLTPVLGCQKILGKGTTVNHVYENADPAVLATTSEQADDLSTNDYERDAMVLANKAFTLVKKTKKLNLTEELLEDEDVEIMDAISTWIGKNMALTHNTMLMAEVASNGTAFKTFASATVIAAGEPEDVVFNDTLGYYLDDGANASWVMRPSTLGEVASLTGNARLYAETPGGSFAKELLGYPVHYSNTAGLTAASAKSVYFGDWFNVGFRLGQTIKLITDPYSEDGVVVLKYSFRTVYGVLQAGAIGYGAHPSA
jgi:HK97 family phage major capsid protein